MNGQEIKVPGRIGRRLVYYLPLLFRHSLLLPVLIYILFFNWLLFLLLGIKLGHQEEDGHTQIMGKKVKTAESYLFNSNTPHCKQLQWDACTLKYYFL